jgi:O-antigen/teichoic acid export membrane protein
LYQVFSNIPFAFERAWVVRKFGAETATFYVVPMTLAIYMQGIVASATLALFPAFNELLNDAERFRELYRKATKVMVAITVMFVTMLICGGRELLQVWINGEMAARGYPILVIHVLTFGLFASMIMIWQLSESFQAPFFNTLATFLWMIITIPLMIVTADRWNIEGIAASRFLAVVVTVPLIFYLERRFLGYPLWQFWRAILWRTIVASGAMAVVLLTFFHYVPLRFIFVGAGFALGGSVYFLVLSATGFFTDDEKQMFRELLGRIRR